MGETKVIYHIDDQETPYLVKIPKSADEITLLDVKNALNKYNYKYFFKSMDDDFGVVKEEIADDKSKLPSYNGRIITWLVTSESSVSDTHSQCADASSADANLTAIDKSKRTTEDNIQEARSTSASDIRKATQQKPPPIPPTVGGQAPKKPQPACPARPPPNFDAASSVLSSDIDTTSFVDSDDDETNTRYSTSTHTSIRHHGQKKKKRRHKLPVLSQASSFSSITDSTMSLNIVTITLNMESAGFLGISIVGQGGDGGIYVGSIMKGGAVAQDGRIEPGDMILEVNGVSFENMSNDEAVDTLRDAVQRPGSITLVVAKCWDPSPKGYFTIPRQEPVRPIDPSAWVMHSEAMRGMWAPRGGGAGPPSVSSMTSATSSLISSVPPNDYVIRAAHSSATSSSSHSSKSYTDLNLTRNSDMALVVRAMAQPDSGLDVRDRQWLRVTIPHSFIGSELVDWLYTHVEGFADRRDARRYACNLLKYGFIQHTVDKFSFSEQRYYIFGNNVIQDMAAMSLADDIDSVSSIGTQQQQQQHRDTIGPLPPPPSWNLPIYPNRPTYPLPPNVYNPMANPNLMLGPPSTPYNFVNDGASYISMPGYNGADSVISSVKRDRTCACIVTHTYKQIRKLWDNPDKSHHHHHSNSRNPTTQAITNSPLLNKVGCANKFNPEIDHSMSSDSDTDDSASSQSKNSKDRSKQTGSSSTTKTGGCDSGVGSVGACGDRSLPPLPDSSEPSGVSGDYNISSSIASSRQQSIIRQDIDDTLKIMGEL